MSLNCTEIDLILKEANLEKSFIQKIVQSTYHTLTISLFQQPGRGAFNLFFSLEGSNCRLHITEKKMRKNEKPLRFMELLRSRIIGYYIESVSQLNANRIIKFVLKNVHEDNVYFLYVRLWTGAANIIFTDSNNVIIDAFYRKPKRNEISGKVFEVEENLSDEIIQERLNKFKVRNISKGSTLNQTIDLEYSNEGSGLSSEILQKEIIALYMEEIGKLNDVKHRLNQQLKGFENPETLKHQASILLMNNSKPSDTEYIEAIDYTTNSTIKIKIDPQKTIPENANELYAKAKKINSGILSINENLQSTDAQIKNINTKILEAQQEFNIDTLKKIKSKLSGSDTQKVLKSKYEKNFTGLRFNIDGFLVMVGRSATENDELLRHCVRGKDLWLHVRDYSGGYVFVKSQNKKSIPLNVLIAAGNLAVYYSKAKKSGEASVYYTEVKNLRRIKGAKLGMVIPEHEKTIQIRLDKAVLEKNELSRLTI